MTRRHEQEAAALARRLRAQNASGGKRAAGALLSAARASSKSPKSRFALGRATRGLGKFKKNNIVQTLHYQKHKGSLAGDEYSQKKALHSITNMLSLNSKERREEFLMESARHPQSDPMNIFAHFSLSLPPGVKISNQMWEFVIKEVLEEVGAHGCSFAAHVHGDTANQHCHVILSRSKPNGKLLSLSHDYWRFREAAAVVADRHLGGRVMDRSADTPPAPPSNAVENANRRASRRGTRKNHIEPKLIEQSIAESTDMTELKMNLEKRGIVMQHSTRKDGTVRGLIFNIEGAHELLAGSSIDRELSFQKIDARLLENKQMKDAVARRMQEQPIAQARIQQIPSTQQPRQRG